jgi:hypothetical protein
MYLNVCPPRPPRYRVTARTAPHRTAPPACTPYLRLARVTALRRTLLVGGYCWQFRLSLPPRFTRSSSTCRERTVAGPDAPSRAEVRRCEEICDGVEPASRELSLRLVSLPPP